MKGVLRRNKALETALRAARRELKSCRDHFELSGNVGGVFDVDPVLHVIDEALAARQ